MINSSTQHLLIIGTVWPEPHSSAAGGHMMELIARFQSAGWRITFASASAKSPYSVDLPSVDITPQSIKINSADFDDFVATLQPSAVMFDRFPTEEQFGWRVTEQCPHAVQILDTEDLHCLRRTRKKAVDAGRSFKKEDLLREESTKREIASILRCDLSLIISEYEIRLLKELFSIDDRLLCYQPFRVDPITESDRKAWPSFSDRTHFITVGNFRHAPNWDAVNYLHHTIWPLIREKLPEAELHIYGAYPTKKAQALHQPDTGFMIKGRADSARAVVRQARVCLAPLRFGAGLKGKLLEAMQCGTPSVTTPIGAEGLAGSLDWSGSVVTEPEALARAAVALYRNEQKWTKARQQSGLIINRRFAKEGEDSPLLRKITDIQRQLEAHRRENFTGAMLRHHSMASTKYMGRWITLKNSQES